MKHWLRRRLLLAVQGSRLEDPARSLYRRMPWAGAGDGDRATVAVMRRALRSGSTCVDVGAYRGDIVKEMLNIVTAGTVYAIEPVKENAEHLQRRYPDAVVVNAAAFDTTGQSAFYHVAGRPAWSGLRRLSYPDPGEEVRRITVRTVRLDDLIPEDVRVDLMKIDVEGAELNVFRGAEHLIGRGKPLIIFEHGGRAIQEFGATSGELYDYVSMGLGLRISSAARWLQQEKPFSRQEFLHGGPHLTDFIAYDPGSGTG